MIREAKADDATGLKPERLKYVGGRDEERMMKGLVEAAEAMVATAFGNGYGLDKDDQISAMQLAAAALDEALKAFKAKRGDEGWGWDEDKALDECLGPYVGQE